MSLAVDDTHVRYGGTVALGGVSIRVDTGEIVALIGANGAGKSTMLKAILGLVKPVRGGLKLDGRSLVDLPTRGRIQAGLSLSPEGRHVFPDLDVNENLTLGYVGADGTALETRREAMFALFPRLKERASQAAGTLSGGEQQMLAIARAMMAGPRVLLLDEPTLGLAPIMIHDIVEFIRRIRGTGVGVLLAEQNAAMALGIADRAYVLQNGTTFTEGPAANVAADPEIRRAYLGR